MPRCLFYRLMGRMPVPCIDPALADMGRSLGYERVGETTITTLFLGMDVNRAGQPPLLFETAVYVPHASPQLSRCSSWEQAEQQHDAAVAAAQARIAARTGVTGDGRRVTGAGLEPAGSHA